MQKLILGINNAQITAGVNNQKYFEMFGFRHYGIDLVSSAGSRTVNASGDGTVLGFGRDKYCGNILVIKYPGAYNHRTGKTADIVLRYYHLDKVLVTKGQKVSKDTAVANYGFTGQYRGSGAHLHLEADYDCKHWNYTPSLKNGGGFLKGTAQGAIAFSSAKNTCFSATEVLHKKTSHPDNQSFSVKYPTTVNKIEWDLPVL